MPRIEYIFNDNFTYLELEIIFFIKDESPETFIFRSFHAKYEDLMETFLEDIKHFSITKDLQEDEIIAFKINFYLK